MCSVQCGADTYVVADLAFYVLAVIYLQIKGEDTLVDIVVVMNIGRSGR